MKPLRTNFHVRKWCGIAILVLWTCLKSIYGQIALICPDNILIQLEPGFCEIPVSFAPENLGVYSDPSTVKYRPASGSNFEIGTTQVSISIVNNMGQIDSCSFLVTVLEYSPKELTLVCNNEVFLTLGEECQVEITPDLLLEGNEYRCFDHYELTVLESEELLAAPIATSPIVTIDQAGEKLGVQLCDLETGDCCRGTITVEHKNLLELTCPSDTIIPCYGFIHPRFLGYPVVNACIPGVSTRYEDIRRDFQTCGETRAVIERVWTVLNQQKEPLESCSQFITIQGDFAIEEITFPRDLTRSNNRAFDCRAALVNSKLTHPDRTGYPTFNRTTTVFLSDYCQASYYWTDEIFNACPGNYEIHRTWKVKNDCLPKVIGENPREHVQIIQVVDTIPPTISCPDSMTIRVDPFNCLAALELPTPTISDRCSAVEYRVMANHGTLLPVETDSTFSYVLSDLPLGQHEVIYIAEDACQNVQSCTLSINVIDQVEPNVVCTDQLRIAVPPEGIARLHVSDIDGGSNDNCQLDSLLVRRNGYCTATDSITFNPWGDYVQFDCCDVNNSVRVELLAIDASGNRATCWMDVWVENKVKKPCQAPKDKVLDCIDVPVPLPNRNSLNGTNRWNIQAIEDPIHAEVVHWLMGIADPLPLESDDSGACEAIDRLQRVDFDLHCNIGNIRLYWSNEPPTQFDPTAACVQTIWINGIYDYCIKFPKNTNADCTIPKADSLETYQNGCDLLAINIQDERFDRIDSADYCFKVRRTYRVLNWCQMSSFFEQTGKDAVEPEITPLVIQADEDCDGWPGDEDVYVRFEGRMDQHGVLDGSVWIDRDCDPWNSQPQRNENCINPPGFWRQLDYIEGYYQYTQWIKVKDQEGPVIRYVGDSIFTNLNQDACETLVELEFSLSDACRNGAFDLESITWSDQNKEEVIYWRGANTTAGDERRLNWVPESETWLLSGFFAIGEHRLTLIVTDGCANQSSFPMTFQVVDQKVVAPTCIYELAVTLSTADLDKDGLRDDGVGVATIWADEFVVSGELSDCTGIHAYSIHRAFDIENNLEVPEPDQTSLILTCDDPRQLRVRIYAWDETGNSDYCEAYIFIQNRQEICRTDHTLASIAGAVYTENNQTPRGVEVALSGQKVQSTMTDEGGKYSMRHLAKYSDYSVRPSKNDDLTDGVSTFDLILISQHILGIASLNSPYKMIAADVNNSKSITTLDLIYIRKVILRTENAFPGNSSWRFVDAQYQFPNPVNPWMEAFPEVANFNDLDDDVLNADFKAIKIGDVNGSALDPQNEILRERQPGQAFALILEDKQLKPGSIYTLPITTEDWQGTIGFQATLNWNPTLFRVKNVIPHTLKEQHLGMDLLQTGFLTTSYNTFKEVVDQKQGEAIPLFALEVEVTQPIRVSEGFQIVDWYTPSEAYPIDGIQQQTFRNVQLNFRSTGEISLELYQNQPNPFFDRTEIQFDLPKASSVKLIIQTLDGATMKMHKGNYPAGKHRIIVDRGDLHDYSGVLVYTLITSYGQSSKQMVMMN